MIRRGEREGTHSRSESERSNGVELTAIHLGFN